MHLVINSYGCSLRKKKGRFKLKNDKGETLFSPEQIEAITLARACMITTDAIMLAIEYDIPIYLIERNGKPVGRFWSHHYGSIATIRRHQLEWSQTPAAARWMRVQVYEKLMAQSALLGKLAQQRPSAARELVASSVLLKEQAATLENWPEEPISLQADRLRGFEGINSRRYFQALNLALPKRFRFDVRSRRPAADPFNALLNYLYGMLYQLVEHSIVTAGLEPTIGILHTDYYRRPALAFDLIEALRPWVDGLAVQLCISRRFKQLHTRIRGEGLWLSEEGRKLAIPAFDEVFGLPLEQEKEEEGMEVAFSRKERARRKCKQLAQFLLKDWPRDSLGSRFLFGLQSKVA